MRKWKAMLALALVALLLLIPAACKRKLPLTVIDGDTVYYAPKGKSYHSTKDCPTLKHSNDIKSGYLNILLSVPKADACDVCIQLTDEQVRDTQMQEEMARAMALSDEFDSAEDKYEASFDAFVDAAFGEVRYSNFPDKYDDWNKALNKAKDNLTALERIALDLRMLSPNIHSKLWLRVKLVGAVFEKHRNGFVVLVETYNKRLNDYNEWAENYNIDFLANKPCLDEYYASKYTKKIDFDNDGEAYTDVSFG